MSIEKLFSILLNDKPSKDIVINEKEIFEFIPELKRCKGFNQNNEWHIYDVYNHILHVIDYVPKNLTLRLAALFHDIGKPNSYTEDQNNVGHFYGHWEESKKIFDNFSIKYNIDKNMSNAISNLILYHDISIDKLNYDERKKITQIFNRDELLMLFKLKKADLLAQNKKYHYLLNNFENQKKELLNYYNDDYINNKTLSIKYVGGKNGKKI